MPRPAQRLRAPLRASVLAVAVVASAGSGSALAAAGDFVVVDNPSPTLPDDSGTVLDSTMSGNGRFVATVEHRPCISIPPAYEYNTDCYGEQHIWRYDLLTGARAKVDKGAFQLGGAREPVLSQDGSVAAWTAFNWFADADTTHVFRSRPGTAQSTDLIPFAGGQGPDGTSYPEFIHSPSISSDGTAIALSSRYYGGGCATQGYRWSADLAGSSTPAISHFAGGCPEGGDATTVGDAGYLPQISGDGKVIVFSGDEAIYRYDVPTQTWTTVPLPAGIEFDWLHAPSLGLSADGSTIAYLTSVPDSPNVTLWSTELATGKPTILDTSLGVPYDVRNHRVALSANGRYVAYTWGVGGVDGGLSTKLADRTAETTRIISTRQAGTAGFPVSAAGRGPSISSDGRYVSFIASDARQAVPDEATPTGQHVVRVDVLGPIADTTAPAKPASIKVSQGAAGAQLTWPAVTDPSGPVTYRLRQRPIAGATHGLIGQQVQTTTSFTLKGLVAGQPYRFAVTAEDAQGNRSTATTVTFTAAGAPDPTPPTITAPAKPYVGTSEQQLPGAFTITGADLANVTAVLIGGQPATGLTITPTKINGTAPRSGDAASLPVTVIGPFGATKAGRFYYRQAGTTETGD